MGTFNSTKFVPTQMQDYSEVIRQTGEQLSQQGYTFTTGDSALGNYFSITKGGLFKSVLGMKTALNVELTPVSGGVNIEAKVGIFGQQIVPTMIMLFVAWPVLLTQIGGMVQQAKLDDQVIQILETNIRLLEGQASTAGRTDTSGTTQDSQMAGGGQSEFCTQCGTKVPVGSRFCNSCGSKIR